jgi:hypothetical protein
MYAAHLYILRAALRDEPGIRQPPRVGDESGPPAGLTPPPASRWSRWAGVLRRGLRSGAASRPGNAPAMSAGQTGP